MHKQQQVCRSLSSGKLAPFLPRARFALIILAGAALMAGGCGERADRDYVREVSQWHAERLERLRSEDGWLTLIGLFPLSAGDHTLGAAADADLRLAADVPPVIGTLSVRPDEVRWTTAAGAAVTVAGSQEPPPPVLAADRDGEPTVLQVGTVRFHVIARGDLLFLRVKDSASEVRRTFRGIDRYPVDTRWRVTATLRTRNQPRTVPMPNVLGQIETLPTPGVLTFEFDGYQHNLIPIAEPGEPLFIVFGDLTNSQTTYGGGRFLYADPPGPDGTVVLDFNRAYNPPCVFTPYATCLQPLPENQMPAAVTAGEKMWGPAH
ncbi:MAG: DUF1684 domain-containing protein [Candidatus Krumholzibacteria bacterium]|nr:DUF1684 domain-containing protein [Candidatus Krumholzibacteria bacterium]